MKIGCEKKNYEPLKAVRHYVFKVHIVYFMQLGPICVSIFCYFFPKKQGGWLFCLKVFNKETLINREGGFFCKK